MTVLDVPLSVKFINFDVEFKHSILKKKYLFNVCDTFLLNRYNYPTIKMVRNSIRQSKENSLSIDDLRQDIHDHGSLLPTSQYSASNFDMMNTLMVRFILLITVVNSNKGQSISGK